MTTARTSKRLSRTTNPFYWLETTSSKNLALLEKNLCQPNCTVQTLRIQSSANLDNAATKKIAATLRKNRSVTKVECDFANAEVFMTGVVSLIAADADADLVNHLRHLLARCKATTDDPTNMIGEIRAYLDQAALNYTIQEFATSPAAAKPTKSIPSPLATLHRLLKQNTSDLNTQKLACIEYLTIFIALYQIYTLDMTFIPATPERIGPRLFVSKDAHIKLNGDDATEFNQLLLTNVFDIYSCLSTLPLQSDNLLVEYLINTLMISIGISAINGDYYAPNKEKTKLGVSFLLSAAARIETSQNSPESSRDLLPSIYLSPLKLLVKTCRDNMAMQAPPPNAEMLANILSEARIYIERLEKCLEEYTPEWSNPKKLELSYIVPTFAELCRIAGDDEEYEKWVMLSYQLKSRLNSVLLLADYMISLSVAFQLHCGEAYEKLLHQTIMQCLETNDPKKYTAIHNMNLLIGAHGGGNALLATSIKNFILNNPTPDQLAANDANLHASYLSLRQLINHAFISIDPNMVQEIKLLYLIMMDVMRNYNKPNFPNSFLRRYLTLHPERVRELTDDLTRLYQHTIYPMEQLKSNNFTDVDATATAETIIENNKRMTELLTQLQFLNARRLQRAQQAANENPTPPKRKRKQEERQAADLDLPENKRQKRGL